MFITQERQKLNVLKFNGGQKFCFETSELNEINRNETIKKESLERSKTHWKIPKSRFKYRNKYRVPFVVMYQAYISGR